MIRHLAKIQPQPSDWKYEDRNSFNISTDLIHLSTSNVKQKYEVGVGDNSRGMIRTATFLLAVPIKITSRYTVRE
jgi:hypothetical protein